MQKGSSAVLGLCLNFADAIAAAEGWKWIEVAPDFAYGHAFGLRQFRGETVSLGADVVRQELAAEQGIVVSLRMVERAVSHRRRRRAGQARARRTPP